MPFGQAGFNVGQTGGFGGFLEGFGGFLEQATPLITSLIGGRRGGRAPQPIQAQAAGFFDFPSTDPGSALGELLGGVTGGGVPTLFRPTASRIAPLNMFSVIGPDGKCHTWLHATPKGWKVNKANVSGRRRHHHHPR